MSGLLLGAAEVGIVLGLIEDQKVGTNALREQTAQVLATRSPT
jgi:hypothetical protein